MNVRRIGICAALTAVLLLSGCTTQEGDYRPLPLPTPQVVYRLYTVTETELVRQINDTGMLTVYGDGAEQFFAVEYRGLSREYLFAGDRVTVTVQGYRFSGEVLPVETSNIRIIMIEDMPDYYAAFLNTYVEFGGVLERKENVIAIPRAYVKKTDESNGFVRVLVKNENGTEEKRRIPVTLGEETSSSIEILEGLQVGDRVIID